VAALGFTLAGTGQAALFNSHFDPLAFVGDAQFQIDDACLARVDGFYTDCNPVFLGAQIDITDYAADLITVLGTAHVDFVPPLDYAAIYGVAIAGGTLVGLNTGLIGSAYGSDCSDSLSCDTAWWLQWAYSGRTDTSSLINAVGLYEGCGQAPIEIRSFLKSGPTSGDDAPCYPPPGAELQAVATTVTFTRIPEPGTLVLAATGLWAGWQARRRRRA
jgi:hypothetical protein